MGDNPYEVLGVSPDADFETIKSAYRKLAKETHPDINKETGAEERFKNVNQAWEILSDPIKKGRFDNLSKMRYGPAVDMSNFEEILKRTGFPGFGGMSGPIEKPHPGGRKGQNIVQTLAVSPIDILLGETVKIYFRRWIVCDACNGRGSDLEKCPQCHGTGALSQEIRQQFFQQIITSPCPRCLSQGWIKTNSCGLCGGDGLIVAEREEEIDLSGLSGDINGATKIIHGAGHYGPFGGPAGDLLIQIVVIFPPADKITEEVARLLHSIKGLMG